MPWLSKGILRVLVAACCLLGGLILAPGASADETIGADVTQMPSTKGTCGYASAGERPCLVVTTVLPGRALASPCEGTVSRFRLNGFVKPGNQYRLRVLRNDGGATFTGTASSAPVAIEKDGVNEYLTSLPIKAGEYIGLDFQGSTEEFGLRWVGTFPTVSDLVFKPFPEDGGSAMGFGDTAYYLFNADVHCSGESGPSGGPAPSPSSEFKVLGLKGTTLSLYLASKGTVELTDAGVGAKGAKALKKAGSKKPTLLKSVSASGGPGKVKLQLKLTAVAKKKLAANGKLNAKANIEFTPDGGIAADKSTVLKIKPKVKKASGKK
jgi:hypothetical protein